MLFEILLSFQAIAFIYKITLSISGDKLTSLSTDGTSQLKGTTLNDDRNQMGNGQEKKPECNGAPPALLDY